MQPLHIVVDGYVYAFNFTPTIKKHFYNLTLIVFIGVPLFVSVINAYSTLKIRELRSAGNTRALTYTLSFTEKAKRLRVQGTQISGFFFLLS